MNISQLQRFRGPFLEGTDRARELPTPRQEGDDPDASGFGATLRQAIDQVDAAQKTADQQVTAFVAGEQENVHEVMIAMNEAKVAFHLLTEVRNRMLETYQELMRMQV